MKEYPWGKGTPTWMRDATLNDSDKSFTVPAGKIWVPAFAYVALTTTATVGNRAIVLEYTDGLNTLAQFRFANVQAASTTYHYYFKPEVGLSNGTTVQLITIGKNPLPAGYVIRVYDLNAIDAAADDLTVVLHYVEYDA